MRERRDYNRSNYSSRSSNSKAKKPSSLAQSGYYPRYDGRYDPKYDKSIAETIRNIELGENLEIISKNPTTQTEFDLDNDSDILENSIAFNYLDPTGGALNEPGLGVTEEDRKTFSDTLEYIWGTLVGDWNNNSDPMQDISNMVAGLIPVVDQALDVRDITAHIYYMVFEKDYQDPWRWVALGLTAVGAIPTVGSVIKGLGKLAIFQDGAKAAAEYAEPLLKALKSINPEWTDIGKLRAAINTGWDDGIAGGKELWLQTLATIKGRIDSIPVPGVFQNYKIDIQKTISKIQQSSDMMLDEALSMIRYNVDEVLDELDRIVRGQQPQLATQGAGNVSPSRVDADGLGRNQPMRMEGNSSEVGNSGIRENRGINHVAASQDRILLSSVREGFISGNAKLGEKLGEGGFGVVHKIEGYPNLVIKIPLEAKGLNEQLIKESSNLSQLSQKGYPTVYKGLIDWTDADGIIRQGIIMEIVEGALSKQILRVGKFSNNVYDPALEALVTSKTVKNLQDFRNIAKDDNIVIDDLQFMITKQDGSIKLIDPARISKLPPKGQKRKQAMKSYLRRIDNLIKNFQDIINKRKS